MVTQAHGALVEVLDTGVLLLGQSGIGKSECALELITRGHRLVADDVVLLERDARGRVVGSAPELIRHHMEIRGIGIFYVPELFGPDSVRAEVEVDLTCRLERWREEAEYERVGLARATEQIAEVPVPVLLLPARPAGSMATVVELAVRDHRQRMSGERAVSRLDTRLKSRRRA
jgi:HPr kinase/phosphorylase